MTRRDRQDRSEAGARLREARIVAGFTQRQLGESLGVTQPTVASIENGHDRPGEQLALALAERVGVPDLFDLQPCPCRPNCPKRTVGGRLAHGHISRVRPPQGGRKNKGRRRVDQSERLTTRHAETRQAVEARCESEGLLDVRGVMALRRLTHRHSALTWCRRMGLTPVERIAGPSGARVLFSAQQVRDAERRWVDETLATVWAGNAKAAGRWYEQRWGSTRMYGLLNKQLAKAEAPVGRRVPLAEALLVAQKELELLELGTDPKRIVDVLIVRFKGRDAVKFPSGERRPKRDVTYRAARAWVERRLRDGRPLLSGVHVNPPSSYT